MTEPKFQGRTAREWAIECLSVVKREFHRLGSDPGKYDGHRLLGGTIEVLAPLVQSAAETEGLREKLKDPEGVAATIHQRAAINREMYEIAIEERDQAFALLGECMKVIDRHNLPAPGFVRARIDALLEKHQ